MNKNKPFAGSNQLPFKIQVARKQHQCDWCKLNIEKNERYAFWVNPISYHNFNRMHEVCLQVALYVGNFEYNGELTKKDIKLRQNEIRTRSVE